MPNGGPASWKRPSSAGFVAGCATRHLRFGCVLENAQLRHLCFYFSFSFLSPISASEWGGPACETPLDFESGPFSGMWRSREWHEPCSPFSVWRTLWLVVMNEIKVPTRWTDTYEHLWHAGVALGLLGVYDWWGLVASPLGSQL